MKQVFIFCCLFLFSLTILPVNSYGQNKVEKQKEFKGFYVWDFFSKSSIGRIKDPRLVYGKENDGHSKTIKTKGTIVDIGLQDRRCGTLGAYGSSLKVWIDEKVAGYNHEYIYLVTICLHSDSKDDFLNKQINFEAEKLIKFPFEFSVALGTPFNSGGVPFYLLNDSEDLFKLRKLEKN